MAKAKDEVGWVIEVDGAGRIEYFSGSIVFSSADPLRAIRFAREVDADRLLLCLRAGELAATAYERTNRASIQPSKPKWPDRRWKDARVREHMWIGPETVPGGDTAP